MISDNLEPAKRCDRALGSIARYRGLKILFLGPGACAPEGFMLAPASQAASDLITSFV